MLSIRKMNRNDVPALYDIALRAFQPDYEKYGVYPPLLKQKNKQFLPPLIFGKVILADDVVVGGAFVVGIGKKGEIGAIFIDPAQQKKGLGRQTMLSIESLYPNVRKWRLETPGESFGLHRFYKSLGYVKVGEMKDKKSGMTGFIFEKSI